MQGKFPKKPGNLLEESVTSKKWDSSLVKSRIHSTLYLFIY